MTILSFFELQDVGPQLDQLETPVPVIDLDVVERNVQRWQKQCDDLGLANRPHVKTHKLIGLAKYQVAMGASGITVQKLGEAEVMAAAGISDMLLTFNVMGAHKLKRLAELMRTSAIKVVADNADMLAGLAGAAAEAGRPLEVLVECDTGAARNGVQTPEAAVGLAQAVAATPGLIFRGLMTYPPPGGRLESAHFLASAKAQLASLGLSADIISSGGSPDMWSGEGLSGLTEYRAGTYIYFDRSLVERGACHYDDCALSVLATVVSRPTEGRAIIDAGSKALTSDLLGLEGFGVIPGLDHARVYALSEEHGFVDVSASRAKPRVGAVVRVIPNHVCPVSNLFDRVVLVRGAQVLGAVTVDARGTVQ
jgi:D-serine deaminase-like pyridoxal phosphate-dependent protein